ncbi:MAG: S24 family peptidase, partial [bacterium]
FGEDLIYNFDKQEWEGNQSKSSDNVVKRSGDKFADLVKNTYRVLLSRGMKGCYVYFMNKDTERFFKSRIEYHKQLKEEEKPGVIIDISPDKKYDEYLPIYSLKAAAGKFGDGKDVHEEGWIKVNGLKLSKSMFVCKIVGHSMEPKIPDGSYCIFRTDTIGGTRQGKVVLVQSRQIHDSETGGSYTVKRYISEKKHSKDGSWKHEKIVLEPLNKDYEPITLATEEEGSFKVVAEFVRVL